ncbi:MAG: SCP2 sterol-binding domain-containing protein [Smithellaceae bacterium]|nr:SCP2 sterol-binding domain-containing protein [Smithellaceae bacterium]
MPYAYGTKEWEDAIAGLMSTSLATEKEPYLMGTPAWIAKYEQLLKNDELYKQVAATWEGTVVLHISAAPDLGLDEDLYIMMDLWHGECRSIRVVPKEAGEAGNYVIRGEYARWRQILLKELDPVKGLMQGKLKLKGELPTIVRYIKAAVRLVDVSASINTKLLDSLTPAEVADFRSWLSGLRAEYGF